MAGKLTRRVTICKATVTYIVGGNEKPGRRVADAACPGLAIRVGVRGSVWTFTGRIRDGRVSTWAIAPVKEGDDVSMIRRRADEARTLLRQGVDPAEHFRKIEYGIPTTDEAAAADAESAAKAEENWTWKQARDAYLAFVKDNKPEGTYNDYKQKLCGRHAPKEWDDRFLCDLTPRDFKALQGVIGESSHSVATGTLRVVKAFMSWASTQAKSGLDISAAAPIKPLPGKPPRIRGRVPLYDELGDMPWLIDGIDAPAAAKWAAVIVLLTNQRRRTVMTIERATIIKKKVHGFGMVDVWDIRPYGTKAKRREGEIRADGTKADDAIGHVIPLSPPTIAVFRTAMAASHGKWLFPQMRKRRADDAGDRPMAVGAAGRAMKKANVGFTPHDLRRAIASWAPESGLGFSRDQVQAVIDHAEGRADTMAKHYEWSELIALKQPVLDAWADFVLEQVRRRRPEGRKEDLPACMCGGGEAAVEEDLAPDEGMARIVTPKFG